jgi:hypothetical protein
LKNPGFWPPIRTLNSRRGGFFRDQEGEELVTEITVNYAKLRQITVNYGSFVAASDFPGTEPPRARDRILRGTPSNLLPQGEGKVGARLWYRVHASGQCSRWNLKWTADDSPSPGLSRHSRQATAEGEGQPAKPTRKGLPNNLFTLG